MKHVTATLMLLVFVTACSTGSRIQSGAARPHTDWRGVEIYFEKPGKPYKVVGMVQASAEGWTDQGAMDNAVKRLKIEASKMGAQAVIIKSQEEESSGVLLNTGPGMYSWVESTNPLLKGLAVVFDQDRSTNGNAK